MNAAPHTLLVLDPGHFHAALSLRKRHPRLADDVFVYARDGPDLDRFVRLVESFNGRAEEPTRWKLHVYRGADCLERSIDERRVDVAIVAGRNDGKMAAIHRLHAAGLHVLGDKPWVIDAEQLPLLRDTLASAPHALDIMTERHEVATRVQRALARTPDVFGAPRRDAQAPAIEIESVHHLYKLVNGAPLVRPAWYFDTAVQGEGITDVTTHLADLAQWLLQDETPFDYARDVELLEARQWPTEVPRAAFERISGLADFPAEIRQHVERDVLHYRCNGSIAYRLRGVPVRIDAIWALAIPPGGGDTHRAVLRGTLASIVVEQGPATGFLTEVTLHPVQMSPGYAATLARAVASLQDAFPGLAAVPHGESFRIAIPERLRTTHEEHFALVLDGFLAAVDSARVPARWRPDLETKYTLLARARQLSAGTGRALS
jgi:predicted dehydrogenase